MVLIYNLFYVGSTTIQKYAFFINFILVTFYSCLFTRTTGEIVVFHHIYSLFLTNFIIFCVILSPTTV